MWIFDDSCLPPPPISISLASPVSIILVCPDSGLSTSPHRHHCLCGPSHCHLSVLQQPPCWSSCFHFCPQVSQWYLSDHVTCLKPLRGSPQPQCGLLGPVWFSMASLAGVASSPPPQCLGHPGHLLPGSFSPCLECFSLPLLWRVPSPHPRLGSHATSLGRPS